MSIRITPRGLRLVAAPALAITLAAGLAAPMMPNAYASVPARTLPDFASLVEQQAPTVVNISTSRRAAVAS